MSFSLAYKQECVTKHETMPTQTVLGKFCVPLEIIDYLHLPFSVLKTTSSIISFSFKKIAFLQWSLHRDIEKKNKNAYKL